jgi:hypothetical protein
MKHPKHGWTHVYTPTEEASHRKNGWLDDEPEIEQRVEVTKFKPEPEPEPVKRGPGRPKGK